MVDSLYVETNDDFKVFCLVFIRTKHLTHLLSEEAFLMDSLNVCLNMTQEIKKLFQIQSNLS